MPITKHIGSLLLAALMLATTIGIGIYEHTCLITGHRGISISLIGESGEDDASCCAMSQGNCKKPASNSTKQGCCEEKGSFFQLDIPTKSEEHYTYQAPLLPAVDELRLPHLELGVPLATAWVPLHNNLPPPETGQRLATLQVYLL
jgi:hypothetical protein